MVGEEREDRNGKEGKTWRRLMEVVDIEFYFANMLLF